MPTHTLSPALGKRVEILLLALLLLSTGAMFSWLAFVRNFDPDEFQHLEMAWLIRIGEVPYRDFFEHHTPIFHFLLLPLLQGASSVTTGRAAFRLVLYARLFDVLLSVAILFMVYAIGRRLASARAALFAVAFLMGSIIFVKRGIEIRPDQFATLALLVSSWLLLPPLVENHRDRAVFLSAAMLAIALLTTQKVATAIPGYAVALVRIAGEMKAQFKRLPRLAVVAVSGAGAAALPVLMYFYAHQALGDFLTDNFLLGAKWVHDWRSSLHPVGYLFDHDAALMAFALGGLALCIEKKEWTCVTGPLLSMIILMPFFPVVQTQYLFNFLPFLAVVAGFGADRVVTAVAAQQLFGGRNGLTAVALFAVLILHATAVVREEGIYRNSNELAKLTYVVENSPPDALVLTGWSPGIAFRRPAFRYFSLHKEIRLIIPAREFAALEQGLRSGAIKPEFVEMDQDMEDMPRGIVSILRARWEPTAVDDLWQLKRDFR